jgi:predicted RNase H-like HicB family nuclease
LRGEESVKEKLQLVEYSPNCDSAPMEIVFSVTQEAEGGYVAECLSHDIFTQGDTWEQVRANVREAVAGYFFDQPKPKSIRLHLVRDELLACG